MVDYRPARTMGFLSKKVRFFLISLLTTFPVCGMIQAVGNVTDTVSGNTDEIQAALFLRNKMSWLEGLYKLQFAAYP